MFMAPWICERHQGAVKARHGDWTLKREPRKPGLSNPACPTTGSDRGALHDHDPTL